MGIPVEPIVQIHGAVERNVQRRPQIAAGERRGAIAGQSDVVRWSCSGIGAAESAVVAVPSDAESAGRDDNDTRAGGGKMDCRSQNDGDDQQPVGSLEL